MKLKLKLALVSALMIVFFYAIIWTNILGQTSKRDFLIEMNPGLMDDISNPTNFAELAEDIQLDWIFSSYFGGNSNDMLHDMTVDSEGNIILVGETDSSNYPTVNAYQESYGGAVEGFVTKLSSDGQEIIFSTFLGGSGLDSIISLSLDSEENIIVAGVTDSTNFPTYNPYQDQLNGSWDSFITKFSSNGNLLYSTFFGGSGDEIADNLAFDSQGNYVFTGFTSSSNFPISANASQTTLNGGQDGYLV